MKKACILLTFLLMFSFTGCESNLKTDDDRTEPTVNLTAEEALEEALLAFTGGDCEGHAVILGADGLPAVPHNSGIAQLLACHVSYEILELSEKGDRATAKVDISAPDAPQLLQQICPQLEIIEEEALYSLLEQLLRQDFPTVSNTVEVELHNTDGGWCVAVDAELSNAITGGLTYTYLQLQQELLEQLREGGTQ